MAVGFWKRVVFCVLYAVFVLLLVELASRAYLCIRKGTPFLSPGAITYAFYPELETVKRERIKKGDEYFDILILGGSVVNDDWGNIGETLREKLENKTGKKVRIHNVSASAHNSLDSYYKYGYLADKEFDSVLFYHAINEVQANNCPPEMFKSDYSHYAWYRVINLFERYKNINFITFPYTLYYLAIRIKEKLHMSNYVSVYCQKKEWVKYGEDVKTGDSFRVNLTKILEIADRKKEHVVLMTYAYYVPEDYHMEQFKNKPLENGVYACPIEIWGKPENVVKGIDAHNEIIIDVAKNYPNAIFVRQNKLIPKEARYFNDICHLSREGCERFVDNIVE